MACFPFSLQIVLLERVLTILWYANPNCKINYGYKKSMALRAIGALNPGFAIVNPHMIEYRKNALLPKGNSN